MQEFFCPAGHVNLVPYSSDPLFKHVTGYGSVEVGLDASFDMIPSNFGGLFHSPNLEALTKLREDLAKIAPTYSEHLLLIKKDTRFVFRIRTNSPSGLVDIHRHVVDMANLFAILCHRPVTPDGIRIPISDDNGSYSHTLDVYPTLLLERRTIELCTRDVSHFTLPINHSNTQIGGIVGHWLQRKKDYSVIISSIQTMTGLTDIHSLHGEIVLYATQFEGITSEDHADADERFRYPIERYGSEKITATLENLFKRPDLGEAISNLRNEIAHFKRPKTLLNRLSRSELVIISQCLHLTILGCILHQLGCDSKTIERYQTTFLPAVG